MSALEIFPNLAIYRIQTQDSTIEVPVDISDVTALARTNGKGYSSALVRLIRSEPFSTGDTVAIEGQMGKLIGFTSEYTDVVRKGIKDGSSNVVRIHQPKIIQSTGSYTKQYNVVKENGADVLLSGIINNLFWQPNYAIILSERPDVIHKFLMTAQIDNPGLFSFDVDEIVFNTKPVLRQPSTSRQPLQARMVQAVSSHNGETINYNPTEVNIEINTVYSWKHRTTISSEMSFPLFEMDQIHTPRVYFLKLDPNAKALYGYNFEVPKYIPPGPVRVNARDFSMIGFTDLEVNDRKVNIKVGIEENLSAQTIIESTDTNTNTNKNRNTETKTFKSTITSKFHHPITLIVEMDLYGTLLESQPEISDRYSNKLIWYFQIHPGSNNVSGKVISTY